MKKRTLTALTTIMLATLLVPTVSASSNISIDEDLPNSLTSGNSKVGSFTIRNDSSGLAELDVFMKVNPDDEGLSVYQDGQKLNKNNKGEYDLGDLRLSSGRKEKVEFTISSKINVKGEYSVKVRVEGTIKTEEEEEKPEEDEEEPPIQPDEDVEEEEEYKFPGGGRREEPKGEEDITQMMLLLIAMLALALSMLAIAYKKRNSK